MNREPRRTLHRLTTAMAIALERVRAQSLRVRYPNVTVHPQARLGRHSRVQVAQGGVLRIGPCAVADNVQIHLGPHAEVDLGGRFIGAGTMIVARASIVVEEGVMIAEMCVIRDSDHTRDETGAITQNGYVSAPVHLRRDAWLASGSTVLKGVTLGRAATAGAGSVVTRDVPEGTTVVGVPARPIG